ACCEAAATLNLGLFDKISRRDFRGVPPPWAPLVRFACTFSYRRGRPRRNVHTILRVGIETAYVYNLATKRAKHLLHNRILFDGISQQLLFLSLLIFPGHRCIV